MALGYNKTNPKLDIFKVRNFTKSLNWKYVPMYFKVWTF